MLATFKFGLLGVANDLHCGFLFGYCCLLVFLFTLGGILALFGGVLVVYFWCLVIEVWGLRWDLLWVVVVRVLLVVYFL